MVERAGALLVDTDMLILLAASGLFARVVATLGYAPEQVRRLTAAPYQVRKSRAFRVVYGEAVLKRVAPIISDIAEAEQPTDLDLLDALKSLDPGEAQLIALATLQPATLLVSGDKRAVYELAQCDPMNCVEALQAKWVSLEAVLWGLLDQMTAAEMRKAFLPVLGHKTLSILLSSHAAADDARCREGIRSYFDDLHKSTKGILYNPAPTHLALGAA